LVDQTDACLDMLAMGRTGHASAERMPTSLALASRSGRGSVAMAAYQSAGNLGFLMGIAGAGAMVALLGGPNPDAGEFALVIAAFATAHVIGTVLTAIALRPRIEHEPLARMTAIDIVPAGIAAN
jgi:hypothetical protein